MATKKDGFGHEKPFEGETNDWITPKWIFDVFDGLTSFGNKKYFDLDPCISMTQPWASARQGYTIVQDGLKSPWFGKVWCNPPYGNNISDWAKKMTEHNNGIMLIFARVETKAWQDDIFPYASGFFFPSRRISFCRPDGTSGSSAGAPSVFISWGNECRNTLIEIHDQKLIGGAFLGSARPK